MRVAVETPVSRTSYADVISDDLIAIGVQLGWSCFSSAPRPETCGADIDVPLSRLKLSPAWPGGATAASTSWPGAITSGLSRSPPPASSGPRDEKLAVNGAGSVSVTVDWLILAVGLAVPAMYALTVARSVSEMCTLGTKWKSALSEFGLVFARIIPTPPALRTARLLLTRALTPRSQSTILPFTFAGSSAGAPPLSPAVKQRAAAAAWPGSAAAEASMSGAGPTGAAIEAPFSVVPFPSVTDPTPLRLCVPAATVVVHGPGCATVPVVGPLLPADSLTNTPASSAKRNATSTGSRKFVDVPLIE